MGTRRNRRFPAAHRAAVFATASAALAASLVLFVPLFPALRVEKADLRGRTIRPGKTGSAFGQLLLPGPGFPSIAHASGTSFEISYTHSVNKGRVADAYTADSRGITLEATRFVSYGAGMSDPAPGNTFASADGRIEIGNINLHIPVLYLAVGVVAGHEISCGGTSWVLADIWPPQTTLAISYRKASVFDYIRSARHDRQETHFGRSTRRNQ